MLTLPFISIPKDVLIPHPGNNFTITLPNKDSKQLNTKNISIEDSPNVNMLFKNAFLVVIVDQDGTPLSKVAALCSLLSSVSLEDKNVYHFISNIKVSVLLEQKNELTFRPLSKLKFNKTQKNIIDSLLNFMKNNQELSHIYDEISIDTDDNDLLLNQTIGYLYPTIDQDYNFYTTRNINKKINLVNLLIITYNSDFKKSNLNYYPEHVNEKINKETVRLNQIPQSSIEYSNTLDYIETLSNLPWSCFPNQNLDINKVQKILNDTHFGLNFVKENILDHFAFEQLTGKPLGTYLLFDGPPGTGKTSIAKAIAKALNRDFVFIALGGVSDEAEIRGHRRTYLGSKPGRIISAFENLKSNNPLILLDEIDKISSSAKGDPASALLEILDPEQNSKFTDRYLEIPYDLSNALIICTSNQANSISAPLKDRLNILTFTNYSDDEKYIILTKHIIPNYLEDYNLETYNIIFKDTFLNLIASKNNLRELKNIIIRTLKYSARKILSGSQSITIDEDIYFKLIKKEKNKRIGF